MRSALAVALLLPIAGCAGAERTWRPDAFGSGRTMAVASIACDPRLLPMRDGDEVPYRRDDANVMQGSSRAVFQEAASRVLEALARTELFALMPAERVLPALPRELFVRAPPHVELAPGYPPPRPSSEASAFARQLGVDAVLNVAMFFGADTTRLDYGFDEVGAVRAMVTLSVVAVDREGRRIWRDVVIGRSRSSFVARRSALDGERLFVPLQEAAAEATDRLVSRLREQVRRQ
jgi:hypothetical protein